MRLSQRLIALTVLAAIGTALAGCSSGTFDPTDMLDWFDTKKKIPGERKPVFPDGVPGVEQGVPKDLYKGAQQQPDQPPVAETAPPAPPAPEPKAKHLSSSRAAARSAPAAESASDAAPSESEEGGAAAVPPAPPPPKVKRKRITAPPPDAPPPQAQQAAPPPSAPPQQQSSTPFPAPLPSGGFSR
ncbi:hypothetical protein V1291_000668 [Nitrobacteraceae bacterium AZCC 1564]